MNVKVCCNIITTYNKKTSGQSPKARSVSAKPAGFACAEQINLAKSCRPIGPAAISEISTHMTTRSYRIIDVDANDIVATALSLEQAYETLELLRLDYPHTRFELEPYTNYIVRGLGRDPDLH